MKLGLRIGVLIFVGVAGLMLLGALARVALQPAAPCAEQIFEGDRFTVCEMRAAEHEVMLVWADRRGQALRSFEALAASGTVDANRVHFATNAGMFGDTGAPIGLFVARGVEEHPINQQTGSGNFYVQPNGVFFVDRQGRAAILPTQDYVRSGTTPAWATQSGPMLVVDGSLNGAFDRDGASRNVRNGVGVRSPGFAYFVIGEDQVSFGKFARFFRDVLKCKNALYLDGVVSSLWVPATGRRDDTHALGPMVVVSNRVPGPD